MIFKIHPNPPLTKEGMFAGARISPNPSFQIGEVKGITSPLAKRETKCISRLAKGDPNFNAPFDKGGSQLFPPLAKGDTGGFEKTYPHFSKGGLGGFGDFR